MKRSHRSAADDDLAAPRDPSGLLSDAQRRVIELETEVVTLRATAAQATSAHDDAACPYVEPLIRARWMLVDARRENAEMCSRLQGLLRQIRALGYRQSPDSPSLPTGSSSIGRGLPPR